MSIRLLLVTIRMNKLLQWIDIRFPLVSVCQTYFSQYYVAKNLNIYYCFGALSLLMLFNQIATGLWLTMFYTPTAQKAFDSIEYIMREINYGWLLRYMHSTGASMLFLVLYLHIFRGLLYGSYQKPRELVWLFGVLLFIFFIVEAFFGYLLPWGQLSFWGAQIMTSLLSAVPFIGDDLVIWLRGDYIVGNATLQRFFALHVIGVPLIVLLFVFLHIVGLHKVGSNNPQGIDIGKYKDTAGKPLDGMAFYPYYVWKDAMAAIIFLIVFFSIVFFIPDMNGLFLESTNFLPANPLTTPQHITPLWYLSAFYAMLRAIPHKPLGVFILFSSVFILFFVPWLDKSPVRSMRYKGFYSKILFTLWIISFLLLTYLGLARLTTVTLYIARIATIIYFSYFLFMPMFTRYETHHMVPDRINT